MNRLHRSPTGHFNGVLAALLAGLLMPVALTAQSAAPTQPAASPAATLQDDGSPSTSGGPANPSNQANQNQPKNDQTNPANSSVAHAPAAQKPKAQPKARQKAKAEAFYLKGVRAIDKGDVHAAEKNFARAAQEDPTNPDYSLDREIAREQGVTELVQSADRARIHGQPDIARARLAEAMALDPKNSEVSQHLDDLTDASRVVPQADDPTATIAPPIALAAKPGKQSFHLKGTEQDMVKQVLSAYGLTPIFDSSVGKQFIHFDADGVTFAQASDLLGLATDTFLVPLDPKSVLVAKDTKTKRTEYERLAVETLHLPGLSDTDINDVGNLVRSVIGIEHVSLEAHSATLTVRAPMPQLVALNRMLDDLLEGKSEVLLDVRLFSMDKTKTLNIGLQPPQSFTLFNVPSQVNSIIQQNQSLVQQIISSGLANAGDTAAIAALLIASGQVTNSILNQPFALFGGGLTESGVSFPAITTNLSLNSSDTRALDDVQLRLLDKEQGTIRSGTRYPIETSSYSSIAASSVSIPGLTSTGLSNSLAGLGVNLNSLSSAQPIPQVQYEDLGLTLVLTPVVERTDAVSIKVDFKLTALEGSSLNGLPVLTNTKLSADVVVNHGASALLMSDMTRQQSKSVSGFPGLTDLPGFQSTTNSQTNLDISDLVIVITPHVIRRRHNERVGPYIPLPHVG